MKQDKAVERRIKQLENQIDWRYVRKCNLDSWENVAIYWFQIADKFNEQIKQLQTKNRIFETNLKIQKEFNEQLQNQLKESAKIGLKYQEKFMELKKENENMRKLLNFKEKIQYMLLGIFYGKKIANDFKYE